MPNIKPEKDIEWVARCIVAALRWSETPLTRDQLTEHVLKHGTTDLGVRWLPTTAARRVRDAFKLLRRQGYPVLSDGTGFKLATTAQERHRAAEKMRKMAQDLFGEADRLEAAPLPSEPVQGTFEGTPGFEVQP